MKNSEYKINLLINYLKDYFREKGYAPNFREMAKFLEVSSTSTVMYYLKKLEQRGLIKRAKKKNRAIEFIGLDSNDLKNQYSTIKIPLIKNTNLDFENLFAKEHVDKFFVFSDSLFENVEQLFLMKAVGDSMIEAGIADGDLVVAKATNEAKNGSLVVAKINTGITIKRLYIASDGFRLQPENISHLPIYTNNLQILGVVLSVIKKIK